MKIKQLPQHILARILIYLFKMTIHGRIGSASVYTGSFSFGVSLGDYILLGNKYIHDTVTIHHEWGHTIQSHRWGWLYLIVIGIPSATRNILTSLGIIDHRVYYDKYPEKQADDLGGIIRNEVSHRYVNPEYSEQAFAYV